MQNVKLLQAADRFVQVRAWALAQVKAAQLEQV